jgi:AcrR family transcriptional regulator
MRSSLEPPPPARTPAPPPAPPPARTRTATHRGRTTGDGAGVPARKGERTRRSVLDAAIARFGREGYRATSVADIARDAGVGGTVAYTYFSSKEALFFAAVDEDAAAVVRAGLAAAVGAPDVRAWPDTVVRAVIESLDGHPLARRLLAGREPEVTARVQEIPALAELRRACAERLRFEQETGLARPDVDPVTMANGIVAILLSLLMSLVQLGPDAGDLYGDDIAAVLEAAVAPLPPSLTGSRAGGGRTAWS